MGSGSTTFLVVKSAEGRRTARENSVSASDYQKALSKLTNLGLPAYQNSNANHSQGSSLED